MHLDVICFEQLVALRQREARDQAGQARLIRALRTRRPRQTRVRVGTRTSRLAVSMISPGQVRERRVRPSTHGRASDPA